MDQSEDPHSSKMGPRPLPLPAPEYVCTSIYIYVIRLFGIYRKAFFASLVFIRVLPFHLITRPTFGHLRKEKKTTIMLPRSTRTNSVRPSVRLSMRVFRHKRHNRLDSIPIPENLGNKETRKRTIVKRDGDKWDGYLKEYKNPVLIEDRERARDKANAEKRRTGR